MADQELAALRDAWDKTTGDGRDTELAQALADAYVADHPELFTTLREMSIEDCVKSVDVLRAAGWVDEQWRVEAWLRHNFEPQNIGGPVEAKVRLVS